LLLAFSANLAEAEGMMALLWVKPFLHWRSIAARGSAPASYSKFSASPKESSQEAKSPFNRETKPVLVACHSGLDNVGQFP
jgi:hypothetical protein